MMAGCYVLHLYCDIEYAHLLDGVVNYDLRGGKAQFTAELGSRARATARKAGWKIGRTYTICPICNKQTNVERRASLHAAIAAGWRAVPREEK